jgi:hypothetical protein
MYSIGVMPCKRLCGRKLLYFSTYFCNSLFIFFIDAVGKFFVQDSSRRARFERSTPPLYFGFAVGCSCEFESPFHGPESLFDLESDLGNEPVENLWPTPDGFCVCGLRT